MSSTDHVEFSHFYLTSSNEAHPYPNILFKLYMRCDIPLLWFPKEQSREFCLHITSVWISKATNHKRNKAALFASFPHVDRVVDRNLGSWIKRICCESRYNYLPIHDLINSKSGIPYIKKGGTTYLLTYRTLNVCITISDDFWPSGCFTSYWISTSSSRVLSWLLWHRMTPQTVVPGTYS